MQIAPRQAGERGRDYALRMLRQNIISADLAPGAAVSENELAAQLNLSRTPVREAIIELSKVNAIEVYPQRGSVVAYIDYDLVDEAQFMRMVMECAVVELLAGANPQPDFGDLQANIALQQYYAANPGPGAVDRLFALDNEFHSLLFTACNKQRIYNLMNGMEIHFDRVRSLHLRAIEQTGDPNSRTVADHAEILTHIQNRDPAAARTAMQTHLTRYKLDERLLREKFPDYFKG